MKRVLWIIVSIASLLAMTAVPAMAAGGKNQLRWVGTPFSLVGQVTAVDPVALTLTVDVHIGNRHIKSYIGAELAVQSDANTRFLRYSTTGGCAHQFRGRGAR